MSVPNEQKRSLEDFVKTLLEQYGKENVYRIQIDKEILKARTLRMVVDTHITGVADIVEETESVLVGDEMFDLFIEFDPHGEDVPNAVTLYGTDEIEGVDTVTVEEGVKNLRSLLADITDFEDGPDESET